MWCLKDLLVKDVNKTETSGERVISIIFYQRPRGSLTTIFQWTEEAIKSDDCKHFAFWEKKKHNCIIVQVDLKIKYHDFYFNIMFYLIAVTSLYKTTIWSVLKNYKYISLTVFFFWTEMFHRCAAASYLCFCFLRVIFSTMKGENELSIRHVTVNVNVKSELYFSG